MSTATHERTNPADHPLIDVLTTRWSPRAYSDEVAIDEAKLSSALEAARWAPSAYNAQPWRFIVARRGTDAHAKVAASLAEFNQQWAPAASVLIVAVAETESAEGGAIPTAVYDLGQAAAHLSIQAHDDGLFAHQMSGFDPAVVSEAFGLESRFKPMTVIALGSPGDPAALPDALRERETAPRQRRSLDEIVIVNS